MVGVDANPEAHEHARLRYRAPQPALRARSCRELLRAGRRGRVPADDRAPRGSRRRARALPLASSGRRGVHGRGVRLDAQRAHARSARVRRAQTIPGTCTSTAPQSSSSSAAALLRVRALRAVPRAQAARPRARAARRLGRVHARLRPDRPLLRLVHARDLGRRLRAASRAARPTWIAHSTSSRCADRERRAPRARAARWRSCCTRTCPMSRASGRGPSARSGCGRRSPAATCRCSICSTRERRDAVDHARAVRPARSPRHRRALRRFHRGCAPQHPRRGRGRAARGRSRAARAELERAWRDYERALEQLAQAWGELLRAFAPYAQWTSSATHAILPLLATDAGRAPTGADRSRSRTARASATAGAVASGCQSAPMRRGSSEPRGRRRSLRVRGADRPLRARRARAPAAARHRVRHGARTDRPRHDLARLERRRLSSRRCLPRLPPSHDPPPQPLEQRWRRLRPRARARPRTRARRRLRHTHPRAPAASAGAGLPGGGLAVCALDTELLGHWWYEGIDWLEAVVEECARQGLELVRLDDALERFEPAPVGRGARRGGRPAPGAKTAICRRGPAPPSPIWRLRHARPSSGRAAARARRRGSSARAAGASGQRLAFMI